jgi:phage host-nuclease inhibitor protein Gam
MTQAITDKLNQLANFQSQRDILALDKQAKIDSVLTPEIKRLLADIEHEYAAMFDAVDANIAEITESVKADVLEHGDKVKGNHLQAVWTKGRVAWNTDALDGYAVDHPELFAFRKEGQPSVSIRTVKG